ncbi:hypothetical protein DFP72DRAFT_1167702, partial [Ephemerocybe angulata]
ERVNDSHGLCWSSCCGLATSITYPHPTTALVECRANIIHHLPHLRRSHESRVRIRRACRPPPYPSSPPSPWDSAQQEYASGSRRLGGVE